MRTNSLLSSAVIHVAVLALLIFVTNPRAQREVAGAARRFVPLLSPYRPAAAFQSKPGGGGSGARELLPAGFGRLPKISPRPFTPPTETPHPNPRLAMEAAITLPPEIQLAVNATEVGDPFSRFHFRSNGTGRGGGIGDGDGPGLGPGQGPGVGPGEGGGVTMQSPRGRLLAPVILQQIDPEYSEEARKARYQGTVLIAAEIDSTGRVRRMRVVRSLGMGLDEKAVEALEKWRFRPASRDGKPVSSPALIEVNFRLL